VALHERRNAHELIMWGLLFWLPYYNNATLSMSDSGVLAVERSPTHPHISQALSQTRAVLPSVVALSTPSVALHAPFYPNRLGVRDTPLG
jgi:hypothetical protein